MYAVTQYCDGSSSRVGFTGTEAAGVVAKHIFRREDCRLESDTLATGESSHFFAILSGNNGHQARNITMGPMSTHQL